MYKLSFILLSLILPLSIIAQTFTNVTSQSGITVQPGMGDVVVWIDHNNNGWLDFFGGTMVQTFFYENNGDGTFTEITAQSGLGSTLPRGVAIGDYDNDGFTDILITSISANVPLKVYRNDSGNGFIETYNTGIFARRAIWLDYDGDGHLDILCLTGSGTLYLLKNNGDGTFTDVSQQMNFNAYSGITLSASDYNNDGLQDIYCASYSTSKTNRLYKNIAAKNFEDVTFSAFVSDFRSSVAVAWGDYNNDGWMDLYVANINSNRNVLFHNNANGTFTDKTLAAGVQDVGDARSCAWLDYNNNGLLDLFTTNHVNPNKLYRNNGDGTFTDVATSAGIDSPQDGFDFSWGDFDRDGDIDVLIAGHSYGLVLLRNEGGNSQNYLNITLVGDYDNKSGIGSRVTVYTDTHMQMREVNGGRGSVSQDALSLHIGLGNTQVVDSIHILWPSGMVQKMYDINANQFITINQEGNVPPAIFHLIEPLPDSLYVGNEVLFKWTSSFDPDAGNVIDYYLHLVNPTHDTIIGPVQDTSLLLLTKHWMAGDSTFWYINASDGNDVRRSWEKWEFDYSHTTGLMEQNSGKQANFHVRSIFPIPVTNELNIDIEMFTEDLISASLLHPSGSVGIDFSTLKLGPGRQAITLNTRHVESGFYLLKIQSNKGSSIRKVVIVK